jgi:hypothetical protein
MANWSFYYANSPGYYEQILGQIGHFTTQFITKMAGPELFVITKFLKSNTLVIYFRHVRVVDNVLELRVRRHHRDLVLPFGSARNWTFS